MLTDAAIHPRPLHFDESDEKRARTTGRGGDGAERTGGGRTAVTAPWIDPIYAGANGSYYTDWEVARNVDRSTWRPCLREERSGKRLVETDANGLLLLVPTTRDALPAWAQVRVDGSTARVVDTRRPTP